MIVSVLDHKPGSPATFPVPSAWLAGGRPLLAGRTGALHLQDGTHIAGTALPDPDHLEAVITMGRSMPTSPTWLELSCCDPLAPVLETDLEEEPLEKVIRNNLDALRDVFSRPRTHLKLRTALVPAGRARRLDKAAANWLAGHTEDWAHLTLRGVHPRRVLAEVRDVRWDLYENRVAVCLVDHLLSWVRVRIRRLGAWLRRFDDLARLQDSVGRDGSWRRKDRVFRLWTDFELEKNRKKVASERMKQLTALRRVLDGLRDTKLYRAIPARTNVPDELRPSNVLQFDANYRKVAVLWRAWATQHREEQLSDEEFAARQADSVVAWRRFCVLLVQRALCQLGREAGDLDSPLTDGAQIAFPGGVLDLRDPVAIRLGVDGGTAIRIVPLLADFAHAREVDGLVSGLGTRAGSDTVVLHLAVGSDVRPECARLLELGHQSGAPGPGLLPVSPWDLGSTERVARALRWALLTSQIRAWPPQISTDSSIKAAGWLAGTGPTRSLLRAPTPAEFDLAKAEAGLTALGAQVAELESERVVVRERAAATKGDRENRAFTEQAKRLNEQIQPLAVELAARRATLDSLRAGLAALDRVAACPVCAAEGRRATATLTQRGASSFTCSCDCGAEWGTAACGSCKAKVPLLRTISAEVLREEAETGSGADWVDRVFGQDVLAAPHRGEPGRWRCQVCGGAAG